MSLALSKHDVSLTSFVHDEGREWRHAQRTTPTVDDAATEAAIQIAGIQIHTGDDSDITEVLLIAAFVRGVTSTGLPLAD